MNRRRNQAEQFVFVATHKKMNRLGVIRNGAIMETARQLLITRHGQMKTGESRPHGWMKKPFAILPVIAVRRNKSREQRHEVKHNQNHAAEHGDAPLLEPLPEQLPRRQRQLRFYG